MHNIISIQKKKRKRLTKLLMHKIEKTRVEMKNEKYGERLHNIAENSVKTLA